MMLSTRGAISTSVAMVECSSEQRANNGNIYLLSELEKVWVSLSVLLRRVLLDARNVKIRNFGSFWTEERLLATDLHRRRYYSRVLCFGINSNFAMRYGLDTARIPLETASRVCERIGISDIVTLCGIPAQTAQHALNEFFLYIGEGLYMGRMFRLTFPGLAVLLARKERCMIIPEGDFQDSLFSIDARHWSEEMRQHCRRMLHEEQQHQHGVPCRKKRAPTRGVVSGTAASGSNLAQPDQSGNETGHAPSEGCENRNTESQRENESTAAVSSARTAVSWRNDAPMEPRRVFMSAVASKGRLFSEIAEAEQRRRRLDLEKRKLECQTQRRESEVERRVCEYDKGAESSVENGISSSSRSHMNGGQCSTTMESRDDPRRRSRRAGVSPEQGQSFSFVTDVVNSGESVYNILDHAHDAVNMICSRSQRGSKSSNSIERPMHSDGNAGTNAAAASGEPEIEAIVEVTNDRQEGDFLHKHKSSGGNAASDDNVAHAVANSSLLARRQDLINRPLGRKDAELEQLLRKEESFIRPISRQNYHDCCTAQTLIYSSSDPASNVHRSRDSSGLSWLAKMQKQQQQQQNVHRLGGEAFLSARVNHYDPATAYFA